MHQWCKMVCPCLTWPTHRPSTNYRPTHTHSHTLALSTPLPQTQIARCDHGDPPNDHAIVHISPHCRAMASKPFLISPPRRFAPTNACSSRCRCLTFCLAIYLSNLLVAPILQGMGWWVFNTFYFIFDCLPSALGLLLVAFVSVPVSDVCLHLLRPYVWGSTGKVTLVVAMSLWHWLLQRCDVLWRTSVSRSTIQDPKIFCECVEVSVVICRISIWGICCRR
jgi:hypothetical protein